MIIGFVGTGIMGAPMAAHLQAGGHQLLLNQHRSPVPETLIAVFTPNVQSVEGVVDLVREAGRYRARSEDLRPCWFIRFPRALRRRNRP